jgi:uncharacterized cupin superfamily protein
VDTSDQTSPFRFDDTILHLSADAATVVRAWSWDDVGDYEAQLMTPADGGRMVCAFPQDESWTTWERHPDGEELVMLLSGRVDLIQDIDGEVRRTSLEPGMAVVNPPGVWHTADVHESGVSLFITPGRGTEHKPR